MIGVHYFIKEALKNGVCAGINRKKCIEALELIFREGKDAFRDREMGRRRLKKILGDDFDRFRENFVRFYKSFEGNKSDRKSTEEEEKSVRYETIQELEKKLEEYIEELNQGTQS